PLLRASSHLPVSRDILLFRFLDFPLRSRHAGCSNKRVASTGESAGALAIGQAGMAYRIEYMPIALDHQSEVRIMKTMDVADATGSLCQDACELDQEPLVLTEKGQPIAAIDGPLVG